MGLCCARVKPVDAQPPNDVPEDIASDFASLTIPDDCKPADPRPTEAPPTERLPAMDLLRGIAILGILPANIPFFSGTVGIFSFHRRPESVFDQAGMALTVFFVFGKFVTLLSILFGAGLALQAWKARAENRPFAGYYVRRMTILFFIGMAHGLFLWFGDILSSYAVVALLALIFTRFSQRLVLWTAAGCLIVVATWMLIGSGVTLATGTGLISAFEPPVTEPPDEVGQWFADLGRWWESQTADENQTRIWREGSFAEMAFNRAVYLGKYFLEFWLVVCWYLLGCFLIGVYLMRRGVFHDFETQRRFVRGLTIASLIIGGAFQALAMVFYLEWPESELHFLLPYTLGGLPMALGYLGLGLFWSHSGMLPTVQHALQATGRMALSNYILQSILCNLVYYRWGLTKYGDMGHAANLGVVALIWSIEIGFSVVWMRFFQIGPLEWAWRSLAERHARPIWRPAVIS
jgi:uncharacterized protein